jgi:uncharacterized protein (TIGR00251 family)
MKLEIKVKAGSRKPEVKELSPGVYRVAVNAPAIEGRANEAVREALAEHFGVSKSRVVITHGEKGKTKRVEILD